MLLLGLATGVDAVYYTPRGRAVRGRRRPAGSSCPRPWCCSASAIETLWRSRRSRRPARLPLSAPARCSPPAPVVVVRDRCPIGLVLRRPPTRPRAVVPAERARRALRERLVHDRRRAEARGLVHPVAQRRRRDRVPGPQGPAAPGAHARPPRLRRAAVRPPRRGRAATATRTRSAGAATRTSRPRSPTCRRRPDVDPRRIGGIGLSVGGELMLETAAETDDLAAVVSDGAGARTAGEELDTDGLPRGRPLARRRVLRRCATRRSRSSSNHLPPRHLKTLVPRIAPRPAAADRRARTAPTARSSTASTPGPRARPRRCGRSRRPATSAASTPARRSTSAASSASSTRRFNAKRPRHRGAAGAR